jgi:hypothetical protein
MKRVYIGGPMQGFPQFNFPAFYAAAEALRAAGYDVVSPAELDDQEDKGLAMASTDGVLKPDQKTWGDYLARDVKLLADDGIQGIIFLPGWQKSKGAKLEAFVGMLAKLEFATLEWVENDGQKPELVVTDRALGWVALELFGYWSEEITIHSPLPGASHE